MSEPRIRCACRRFGPSHVWEPGESCPPVPVEPEPGQIDELLAHVGARPIAGADHWRELHGFEGDDG